MIWAVDLDDDNFSALSGLMKKSIGSLIPPDSGSVNPNGNDVSQQWSNGGRCEFSECRSSSVVNPCKKGFVRVGSRTCGSNQLETICCPATNAPSSCEWRGGESGGLCNGQCHKGEVNLQSIRGSNGNGTHSHCTSGWQIFCCRADRWATLIDECSFAKCNRACPITHEEITSVYTTSDCGSGTDQGSPFATPSTGYRKYCCPKPAAFKNCHWNGKGDCGDNTCTNSKGEDDGSIEVMTDRYGDGTSTCRWQRNRVLCCNPPDIDAFTPVKLEYLFPELPPVANTVKYDIQSGIGNTGETTIAGEGTWGMIVIDGPKSAVTSVNKRDNSHLEFLDCDKAEGEARQTVRYICLNPGSDSNCDDMLLDGIEGTVLKMPDNCGPGTHAVAHKVHVSSNQTRPSHLADVAGPVMELTFDYNFGLVKRDSGDIHFRVDYSSIPEYWTDVVDEPGVLRKREEMQARGFGRDSWWKGKYDTLRTNGKGVRELKQSYSREVFADKKTCSGRKDAYLDIKATVGATIKAKWGFTLIGKISPWRVSEAYAFFDANTKVDLDYDISAKGKIASDDGTEFPLQRTALSMYEFRHPGIGHFRPWFNADVGVKGEMEMEGNFTISYQAGTASSINQGYPSSGVGLPTGYGTMNPKGTPFSGAIKSASTGGLKIRTTTETGLEIVFNKYGNSGEFLGVNMTGTLDTYVAVQVENNKYTVSIGSDKASSGLIYANGGTETIAAWDADSSSTVLLGDRLGAKQVASGSPGDDKDPKKGPNPHYIEYDGDASLAQFKNMLSCRTGEEEEPACNIFLCEKGTLDCSDNEDGPSSNHRSQAQSKMSKRLSSFPQVEKKGANSLNHEVRSHADKTQSPLERRVDRQRTMRVTNPATGRLNAVTYDDAPHPSVGQWANYGAEGQEQYDNAYTLADFDDCNTALVVAHALPVTADREAGDRDYSSKMDQS
jgi:hypothetical protein